MEISVAFRSSYCLLDLGFHCAAFSVLFPRRSRFVKLLGIWLMEMHFALGSRLCLVDLTMCGCGFFLNRLIWSGNLLLKHSDLMDLFREFCNRVSRSCEFWNDCWYMLWLGWNMIFSRRSVWSSIVSLVGLILAPTVAISDFFLCLFPWIMVPPVWSFRFLHFGSLCT